MEFINYIISNSPEIIDLLIEHIKLTSLSVFIAILIGIPVGILISYVKKLGRPVLALANILQAIPSMALLGFTIPFLGIGTIPAILMVVLYSLLPIIKNTYIGLENINPQMIEAATGIGLTKWQILTKVQIPLALPVIMSGIRISAVSAVGLMTLAAFCGAGGLGYLVYAGIRSINNYQILSGAIPACLLALFIDYILGIVENLVTPKYNKDKTNLIMCFTKDSTVKLADTLTTVNDYSFSQAPNIEQVNFPDAVTTIGNQVFTSGLTSLENINIGPNVISINPLFKYNNYYGVVTIDANNQNYSIEDNELYNKDKTELIAVLYDISGQYIVKEGVTKIGGYALHYMENMTSIVLPDGLKEIGSSFQNSGLTTIYIPNSVDTIASDAFESAANLTQIQIDKEPGSIVGSPWGAIRGDRIVEWLREE